MFDRYEQFLLEQSAVEQAHKLGLVAAGFGLWKNKDGVVVKKSVDNKLIDVRGSAANPKHYDKVPSTHVPRHAEHDMSSDIVAESETAGTTRTSSSSDYAITEESAVHKDAAADLHDALVGADYKHISTSFGQIYQSGKTAVMISNKPEIGHNKNSKSKDHHKIVIKTDHQSRKEIEGTVKDVNKKK